MWDIKICDKSKKFQSYLCQRIDCCLWKVYMVLAGDMIKLLLTYYYISLVESYNATQN